MADAPPPRDHLQPDLAASLLRDFPLCVVVTDRSGRVVFFNRAGQELLGYRPEEVVGRPVSVLRASGRHASAMREIEAALEKGCWAGEIRAKHKDGTVFPAQVVWSVLREGGGEEMLVVVFRDLTAEREREERLLREARERAIGKMAGRIAHEFNNLFAGMISAADFALAEGSPERLRRALERCLSQAERGARVTHLIRLLALETHPAATLIDPAHLLEHLLASIASRAEEQGVRVERNIQPVGPIRAEVGLIEQAIEAVLRNALEAMPHGGTLTVGLEPRQHQVVLTISDTGPGIPPELAERIFEPFFTTKETALGHEVGMVGLGLALARRIIEEMGGRIELDSQPGMGATFRLILPKARNENGA